VSAYLDPSLAALAAAAAPGDVSIAGETRIAIADRLRRSGRATMTSRNRRPPAPAALAVSTQQARRRPRRRGSGGVFPLLETSSIVSGCRVRQGTAWL
jgi:hypothetical protein